MIEGENPPAPSVQDDPIDLQFAFADVVPYLTDEESLTLRAGRFGMSFGSARLVATRAAPNIPSRFDGFEMIYSRPLWEATAFLTRPVEDIGGISGSDSATTFWGLYITHWLDAPRKLGVDLYYLGIANEHGEYASGTGNEHRHTYGTRLFGTHNHWDWNGEAAIQVGTFGNESILAWTASLDSGYTWDTQWQPRLGLKVDVASGDTNPNDGQQGTFNALYFKSAYFNDASLIRPANLIDVHPNLSANLTRTLSVNGGADVFWRYSRNDAVYAVPGFIAIPAQKTGSSYIGTALDVNLQWQIQRHLTFGASYVHFFTGSYVHGAGMLVPPPGSESPEFGILRTFASEQDRDAFYNSPMFKAWEVRIMPLIEGEPVYRQLTGLEAWFRSPQNPPPQWKMALLTWVAVWPVSMAVPAALNPLSGQMPNFIFAGVVAGGIVLVLTWVAMPALVKVARGWLQPKSRPTKNKL